MQGCSVKWDTGKILLYKKSLYWFQHSVFVSPAACCWCRVSCCLFLEMKTFCLLKYSQSRITQARGVQGEENQDQSMKGCSVNSERCKDIHRNCNSGQIGLHIHKDS